MMQNTTELPACRVVAFETDLGWVALAVAGNTIRQLTFAHHSADDAIDDIRPELNGEVVSSKMARTLVDRIRAYAKGDAEDFAEVAVDMSYLTPLGVRVFTRCRRIARGRTQTYGQLAAAAGCPDAARAVGNFLASNRTPLLVPCHRVVAAGGRLGGFTAPGGVVLKRRLLDLEG